MREYLIDEGFLPTDFGTRKHCQNQTDLSSGMYEKESSMRQTVLSWRAVRLS